MKSALIRKERARLGMTQPQLAAAVGVDQTQVSRWERGLHDPGPAVEAKLRALFSGETLAPTIEARLDRIEALLERIADEIGMVREKKILTRAYKCLDMTENR